MGKTREYQVSEDSLESDNGNWRKFIFAGIQLFAISIITLAVTACVPRPPLPPLAGGVVSPFEFIPSNHTAAITYQPTGQVNRVYSRYKIGSVVVADDRNAGKDWLGSIRGRFGNPVKRLFTETDTDIVVRQVFETALEQRDLLGAGSSNNFQMKVSLTKFDTNYLLNKEAHAHFTVSLLEVKTGSTVFSKSYRTDNNRKGTGEGIDADVADLVEFANETLNETVDKALDDEEFLAKLQLSLLLI